MRQPVPAVSPHRDPGPILAALGTGPSLLPAEIYDNGIRHAPVVLADPDAVAGVVPDMGALARAILAEPGGSMCVAVLAGAGRRWKARVFAPAAGVPEDPATGSTAGALVCHLARHHAVAFGDEIEISQGDEIGRPSKLHARVTGNADAVETIEVGGSAVIVARGEFRL
jgi:trans-2,3-dihydro-3-hydroxyanthranilate isomerase